MKKKIIFLTGCVNPGNMSFTALRNPEVRYWQYVDTIRFYLSETDLDVLFIENSGTDISKEFENKSRLEFITFQGNNFDKLLGKGYGEMEIIKYAIQNSVFFNNATFIFKITGRYKVLNIKSYIKQYNQSNQKIEILLDLRRQLSYSDSRFFGAKKEFFNKLVEYKEVINDSEGFFFEHALSKAVHNQIEEGLNYSFLKDIPRYSAISGTDSAKFKDSWLRWFPRNLMHNLRFYLMKY